VNTPQQDQRLPRTYGKYELLKRIGHGGMAEVFKARLPGIAGFEKTLVIKRLHPRFCGSQGFVQMFIDEAKLAAKVQHKNIVQVFELGSLDNGELFIAMEYVDGIDLKGLLAASRQHQQQLPLWFALHAAVEVLDALAYAHELVDDRGVRRNIVHNDVTPENVFIARNGDVKLGDFGVAHDDSRVSEPFPGQMKGKVPYMSPEQLAGERVDSRSDVFACAIVLWETLTQRRLFHAATQSETMARICGAPRLSPSRFNPEVPPELDAIVLNGLQVDRDERASSAKAFQQDLLGVLTPLKSRVDLIDVRAVVTPLLGVQASGGSAPDLPGVDLEPDDGELVSDDEELVAEQMSPEEAARHLASPSATGEFALQQRRAPVPPAPPAPPRMPPPRPISASRARPVPGLVQTTDSIKDGFTYTLTRPERRDVTTPAAPAAEVDELFKHFLQDKFSDSPPPVRRTIGPVRKILSAARQTNLYATAPTPSTGPDSTHPFWLRGPDGQQDGPLEPAALMHALATRPPAALTSTLVSADQVRWVSSTRLLRLLSEDLLPDDISMGRCTFLGTLKGHSLTSVLGELARTHATGRLVLLREGPEGVDRRELHVRQGALTAISCNPATLALWKNLLSSPFFAEHHLPESVYTAVRIQRPVEALLSAEAQAGLSQARALLARHQLREIYRWDWGQFGFDPEAAPIPGRATPLWRLLPRFVARTYGLPELRRAVQPHIDVPLVRTPDFDEHIGGMEFHRTELERIEPLGHGYTLGESLAQAAPMRDDKYALVISYVLTEAGLLKPDR